MEAPFLIRRNYFSNTLKVFAVGILLLVGMATSVRAEGLSGYFELFYSHLNATLEDDTGQRTDTKGDNFRQRYSLTLDRRIYPNLTLLASGFVERFATTTETDGTESDSTITKLRPYVELRLRTPLYLADAAYSRTEEKTDISGSFPRTTVRETYSSNLQWRPDGFPDLRFQYFHTNNYDRDRLFRDTTDDRFQATALYQPVTPLILRYEGILQESDNRLEDFQVREVSHTEKVIYSDAWWGGVVTVFSDYDLNRRETEVTAGGGGEVSLSVSALEGLSSIDDTPEEGALDLNPALIDGNLAAGVGIDLGLPPPGGDNRLRNFGVRFAVDAEVNTLLVYVDRELPQEIASSFSWRVYSSPDNRNWTFHAAASSAAFETFFNRFEVRFPAVTQRYVKVVVEPLSPAVPRAIEFPTILVTELQAAIRRPVEEVVGKQVRIIQRYNLGIQTRILQVPSLIYEFSYFLTKSDPGSTIWSLSNGLAASHRFTQKLSGAARVTREDGQEAEGNRVAYIYTASMTAVPIESLNHTLVFSGRNETLKGRRSEDYSLFLNNIAHLYQGVDLSLGGGGSISTSETGRKTDATQLNADLTLIPNRKVTINLSYTDRTSRSSGGDLAVETTDFTRTGRASLSLRPLRTVYLFGAWEIESRSEKDRNTFQEYTFSFSPFPGGMLHLNFYYNERFRSEDGTRERTVTPNLRWNIRRGASFDLAYTDISIDSDTFRRDVQSVNGTLRVSF